MSHHNTFNILNLSQKSISLRFFSHLFSLLVCIVCHTRGVVLDIQGVSDKLESIRCGIGVDNSDDKRRARNVALVVGRMYK